MTFEIINFILNIIIIYIITKILYPLNKLKRIIKIIETMSDLDLDECLEEVEHSMKSKKNKKQHKKDEKSNVVVVENTMTAIKRQQLCEVIAGGGAKEYLDNKKLTIEYIKEATEDEITNLHAIYEAKLGKQMKESISDTCLSLYSTAVTFALPIDDKEKLADELKKDPLITKTLGMFAANMYYNYGPILMPLVAAAITFKHVKKENNITNIYTENNEIEDGRNRESIEEPIEESTGESIEESTGGNKSADKSKYKGSKHRNQKP